ncbi:MAG: hypothetical protein R3D68_11825 [Hyphomicrobiaceae bacterium]
MKTIAATLLALGLAAGAANARPIDTVFTDLGESAPHSIWTDLNESAPRSPFVDLQESAPRSYFDDLQESAPRSAGSGETLKP